MNLKVLVRAAVLGFLVFGRTATQADEIELVSRTRVAPVSTATASGDSLDSQYSPDASFVLFASDAPDLIDGSNNGEFNLFIRSRANGVLRQVSVGIDGAAPNGSSEAPSISADNRFVAFQSSASNLAPNDGNGLTDIFLRDLVDGTTTLVSHTPAPVGNSVAPNGVSEYPQISRDGTWVVFESDAGNLISPGDTNNARDIYAWNRVDGSVHLVSAGPQLRPLATTSLNFIVTGDSRSVLFEASGQNLVQTTKTNAEIYLRDLQNETTRWVSWPATNLTGMSKAAFSMAVISADSRFVFFVATPAPPTTLKPALVRVDLNDDSALMITNNFPVVNAGSEGAFGPSITDDGQTVVWSNGLNVYLWNALLAQTQILDGGDATATRHVDSPQISGDGRYVLFVSTATNLVAGVDGSSPQIYLFDTMTASVRLVSHDPSGDPVSDLETYYAELSPDGTSVLIETSTPELIANDANSSFDVFEWDSATGTISLLSPKQSDLNSVTANGNSSAGAGSISAGGRYVVFKSTARLTANDTNDVYDVYLLDRLNQTTTLISATPDGFSPGAVSGPAMITPDGKWVVFESNAVGLAGAGDTRTIHNAYARNVDTGEIVNISGTLAGSASIRRISGNSRYVFLLNGTTLLRHDLTDHTFLQVAINTSDVTCTLDGNRVSFLQGASSYLRDLPDGTPVPFAPLPLFSADGSTVVYQVFRVGIVVSNLVTGFNRTFSNTVGRLAIDSSARIIAYQTPATAGPTNFIGYIDTMTGENVLVSPAFGASTNGNNSSTEPVVSADGRFIAFESWASNLIENDSNNTKDVFLYDRYLDRLSLVSHKASNEAPGDSLSGNPYFSPDGKFLVFLSFASDLVANDDNQFSDVFFASIVGADSTEDTDSDGLTDAWERANFSTLKYGASDDFDGDGFSNGAEFRAGTNPLDAGASLSIKSIEATADGARRIVWKTAANKNYVLEMKPAVDAAQWLQIGDTISAGATAGEAAVLDSNNTAQTYYRVRLVE